MNAEKTITVLVAEDDEEDRMLAADAWRACHGPRGLSFVEDGEQLLEYLRGTGAYGDREASPLPGLILLDLNMPRKNGREALREIKADPEFRRIPVVVMSTSRDQDDVVRSYEMGASSFITKPALFDDQIQVMKQIGRYWIETVELPGRC